MNYLKMQRIVFLASITLGLVVASNAYFDQQNSTIIGGEACDIATCDTETITCPTQCEKESLINITEQKKKCGYNSRIGNANSCGDEVGCWDCYVTPGTNCTRN